MHVYSVNQGNWSLIGPYKENRDRLDFYGSNMQLFEEMFKQNEKDRELGSQFMAKRKNKKKRIQEKKYGKIPDSVKAHPNPVTNINQFTTTNEEEVNFNDEDDSVIMKVIKIGKGGLDVEITEFETEYEASTDIIS